MDVTEPTPDKGTEGSAAGPVPPEHHPSAEAPVQEEEGQVREVEKAIDGGEAATNVVSRIYVYIYGYKATCVCFLKLCLRAYIRCDMYLYDS